MLETCLFPLQNRFLLLADFFFFSSPFKRPDLTEIDPTKKAAAQDQHYNNVRPTWKHYLEDLEGFLF